MPMTRRISLSVKDPYVLVVFVLALMFFVAGCFAYPETLVLGRDGHQAVWWGRTGFDWSSPLGVTTIDPMQGMGSMLMPVSAWWIPAFWPLLTSWQYPLSLVAAFCILFLELSVSTYALARAFGFQHRFSALAGIYLAFLILPPFTFVFGMQGWLSSAIFFGNSLSLGNLMVALFYRVGLDSPRRTERILIVLGMPAMFLLYLIGVPMWNGGIGIAYAGLMLVIFLASPSMQTVLWRAACGVAVLVFIAIIDLPHFYKAAYGISARFQDPTEPLFGLRWPASLNWEALKLAQQGMCYTGLFCRADQIGIEPRKFGSTLFLVLPLAGALLAVWAGTSVFRRFSLGFFALWILTILDLWAVNLGMIKQPSPFYGINEFLPYYPIFAIFTLYFIEKGVKHSPLAKYHPTFTGIQASRILVLAGVVGFAIAGPWWLKIPRKAFEAHQDTQRPVTSDIVNYLVEQTAITPKAAFRGSTASIYDFSQSQPPLQDIEAKLLVLGAAFGNLHAFYGFWEYKIPTLEESYGRKLVTG